VTARSLSTPAAIFAAANALQSRWLRTALWIALAALVHPLMAVFARAARGRDFGPLALACRALVGLKRFSLPRRFERFSEIQPMLCLQLVYCLIGEFFLKNRAWRWALLFVPLCGGMWFSARQLFPATEHLDPDTHARGRVFPAQPVSGPTAWRRCAWLSSAGAAQYAGGCK